MGDHRYKAPGPEDDGYYSVPPQEPEDQKIPEGLIVTGVIITGVIVIGFLTVLCGLYIGLF